MQRMDDRRYPWTRWFVGLALVLSVVAGPAVAADADREGRWQFYIPLSWVGSETIEGQGGTRVETNDDLGWGVAFGYNFDERWSLGLELNAINVGYKATVAVDDDNDQIPDETVLLGGTLDAGTLQVTGQFNFLKKTVTPFIRAGVGTTYIDSNIAAGPPVGTCWWHPYWGYICDYWQPTYGKSVFSYGAGVGVRADIGDKFYLEGSVNNLWIEGDKTGTSEFLGYRLHVGWAF